MKKRNYIFVVITNGIDCKDMMIIRISHIFIIFVTCQMCIRDSHDPLVSIIFSQLVKPLGALPYFTHDRPVFSVRVKSGLVSHFRHLTVKVFQSKRLADRFIHCLPCHVVPCRHPILFRLIKCIGFLSAAWMFYDRKGIFQMCIRDRFRAFSRFCTTQLSDI